MKLRDLVLPQSLECDQDTLTDTFGRFYAEPFEKGYGHTIGNSLRRILLSSLEGCAVSAVKIDKVMHEYSTIKGVREDVVTILLNLKQLRFKLHAPDSGVRRVGGANAAHRGCRCAAQPPGHSQAHPPGASRIGRGGAPGGGVRRTLGAAAVRFSPQCAAWWSAAPEAALQRRAGVAAAPVPPRPRQPRMPHHGPLRGFPDYRPFPHRRTGGIDVRDPARQHGVDGPSGPLRPRVARRAHAIEGEP